MREPKFKVGDLVRVRQPDAFISSFEKKISNRDALVLKNFDDWITDTTKGFKGRVYVEFQRRNGRGKTFREVMNERDLIAAAEIQEQKDSE